MGTAVSGDSELIRVTLIDYFTGAVLVNNIVEPDVPMQHLNTQYSGVTWADMSKAKRKGTCLGGKTRAREALWRYVGPETVVVGHGVSNDLRALRWIHPLVVDSFVTELTIMKRKEAEEEDQQKTSAGAESEGKCKASNHGETSVLHTSAEIPNTNGNEPVTKTQRNKGRERGSLSLKTLVKNRLDRDIQMRGNQGHDSLEDATAARDLIHWIITNPDSERLFWGHKLAVGIILELDNV
jgi:DNA polymerase III epsilon subunit-like protein